MNTPKILIADDDRTMRKGIRFELEESNYQIFEAETVQEARDLLTKEKFQIVITDLKMPEITDGMQVLAESKNQDPSPMVLIITGFGSIKIAVKAMQAGADDFVTKETSIEEIKLKVEKLIKQHELNLENVEIRAENKRLREEIEKKYKFENLIGNSHIFHQTLKLVGKVAEDGYCTVLLQGESGTGKELVAKAIHYNSPRKDKPYIIANIAAIPETLMESELFGHVKGAFTDAVNDRDGKFRLAESGTLFLDEIGDLSLKLQAKLLRVLQEKTFEPLGSNQTIVANVRIIAATNQNLQEKVSEKTFREDLFYRLNVIPITLPPLRERQEDIPLLAHHFLEKFSQERNKKLKFNNAILPSLMAYNWPGNVRELENVIEQMVVLATTNTIQLHDISHPITSSTSIHHETVKNFNQAKDQIVQYFEKQFLQKALKANLWNVTKTAKEIGVSREGLHRMMKRLGLEKTTS